MVATLKTKKNYLSTITIFNNKSCSTIRFNSHLELFSVTMIIIACLFKNNKRCTVLVYTGANKTRCVRPQYLVSKLLKPVLIFKLKDTFKKKSI